MITTVTAFERARSVVDPLLGQRHPGRPPALDDAAVPVDGEPVDDGVGDRRPDAVGGRQLLGRRRGDAVDRPELAGQRLGRGRSDVPDRQPDQHPPQRPVLGQVEVVEQLLTRRVQVPRGARPTAALLSRVSRNSSTWRSLASSRAKTSPSSCTTPAVEQGDGRLVAQRLDVERAAAGEVEEPLAQLGRAGLRVGAADVGVALLLGTQRRCRTRGTAAGMTKARSSPVAQRDDRPDDLGDDVTGLAQHHRVADQHALALDLGRVVQRRQLDGRAGHLDRLHHAVTA